MSTWTSLIGALQVLAPRQCVDSEAFLQKISIVISTDAPVGSEGGLKHEVTIKKDDNDMLVTHVFLHGSLRDFGEEDDIIELNTWWLNTINHIGNIKNGVIRYNVANIRGTIRSGVFVK